MFDYDARPVTPQIVLVGTSASRIGYSIRDFLSRNGLAYEWVDVENRARVESMLGTADVGVDRLPVCVLPDGTQLAPASVESVAAGLGMVSPPLLSAYDLTIVGAGPAGLAASVYAASEGLRTLAIEAIAPGGQAGTTSMIDNYLGFPQGISGSELAVRATAQARRFGAEILLARTLVGIARDDPGYVVELSDGTTVPSRAIVLATGVEWRRLEVPGIEELLGAGVYYGAAPSEAVTCRGCRVAIVGGGNSAGQAAVRFSRYASEVTLVVRGADIGRSMSRYLVDRVRALENVKVRESTRRADTDRLPLPLYRRSTAHRRRRENRVGYRHGGLSANGNRRRWNARRSRPVAAGTAAAPARDEPSGTVRGGRRAKRLDQTLLSRDRRRRDGRRARTSAVGRAQR
jgi:thioredoxin reductase (NADPH)